MGKHSNKHNCNEMEREKKTLETRVEVNDSLAQRLVEL